MVESDIAYLAVRDATYSLIGSEWEREGLNDDIKWNNFTNACSMACSKCAVLWKKKSNWDNQ